MLIAKPYLGILAMACLVGCSRLDGTRQTSNPNTHNVSKNPMLIVGAGQSNMERMNLSYFLAAISDPNVTSMNVAVGGTSLSEWEPTGGLYRSMISKIQNHQVPVKALLFSQGENEALPRGEHPETWALRFTNMVRQLRLDLHNPNLVVIFTQLGKNQGWGQDWEIVKTQQASVHIQNVYMIRTDDIDPIPNDLHYTEVGYKAIAERLAAVYLEG